LASDNERNGSARPVSVTADPVRVIWLSMPPSPPPKRGRGRGKKSNNDRGGPGNEGIRGSPEGGDYDLVTLSYVLGEVSCGQQRRRSVVDAWRRVGPGGLLVVVEPGTPVGFARVAEARWTVLSRENGRGEGERDNNGEDGNEGMPSGLALGAAVDSSPALVDRALTALVDAYDARYGAHGADAEWAAQTREAKERDGADDGTAIAAASADPTPTRRRGGAYVVAPCPGDGPCPMAAALASGDARNGGGGGGGVGSWCAGTQRFRRPPATRATKGPRGKGGGGGSSSLLPPRDFQDERFCYVVLRRGQRPTVTAEGDVGGLVDSGSTDPDVERDNTAEDNEDDDRAAAGAGTGAKGGRRDPKTGRLLLTAAGARFARGRGWAGRTGEDNHAADAARAVSASSSWPRVVRAPRRTAGRAHLQVCRRVEPTSPLRLEVREHVVTPGGAGRAAAGGGGSGGASLEARRLARGLTLGDLCPPGLLGEGGRLVLGAPGRTEGGR